jgi:hypothetical protein
MYNFFTEPDYLKSANDLKSLNAEIETEANKLKNDKDPNAIKEPLETISELKPKTPLELGGLENTFDVSKLDVQSAPAPDVPEVATKSMDQKLDFLGTKGVDPVGATMALGNSVLTTSQTETPNAAAGIANSLKMGLDGAKAGMAIGGPIGAGIVGGASLIYAGIDAVTDIKKMNKKKVVDQRNKDEELVQAREQGQRTEDGLDSLTKLTAIRKQQQSILT